jgi:hypothetical protein
MPDLPPLALSIRQPWAWAVIAAGKDIENRDWPTRFRGPVAIHASAGMTRAEWSEAAYFISRLTGASTPAAPSLHRGGIIGVAEVVGCVEASDSPWFFGRYGFVLRNSRAVPFIPVKGALGFFKWQGGADA